MYFIVSINKTSKTSPGKAAVFRELKGMRRVVERSSTCVGRLAVAGDEKRVNRVARWLARCGYAVVVGVLPSDGMDALVWVCSGRPDGNSDGEKKAEWAPCVPLLLVPCGEACLSHLPPCAVDGILEVGGTPVGVSLILELAKRHFSLKGKQRESADPVIRKSLDKQVVDQAKRRIMARFGFEEPEAYRILRTEAMRQRKTIADIARAVLDAGLDISVHGGEIP